METLFVFGMMESRKTIVLVLRSGGDFTFRDVLLMVRHINKKWKSEIRPRIVCLWDQATEHYDLGNFEVIPLKTKLPGTWSRMHLYSPEMELFRPFLYIDLDTAIINSLENIFELIQDPTKLITLEDFWQKGQLATGLVWVPANSDKVNHIWNSFNGVNGTRMDHYIRSIIKQPDLYWQQITSSIHDFKPKRNFFLQDITPEMNLICFHGKPRIHQAVSIPWVKEYVESDFPLRVQDHPKVTVIIPYKVDRGWLQQAIDSVPKDVQLLVSQGEGNWPENFNKVLDQAEGDYIRWLHEDDMLTSNCIADSIKAIEEQGVDFIHGNAIEFTDGIRTFSRYIPKIKNPTLQDLLQHNCLHSATMMYKREVFEKLGGLNETLNTAEEFEFNLRCLKAGLKLGYCDTFLAHYRRHPAQKVRVVSVSKKNEEREMVRNLYR